MSKSLTEKWKDGELPEGTYYVMFICGRYGTYEFENLKGFGFDNDLAYIKEVLAPVPSCDEYKKLQVQLKEANDTIKRYRRFETALVVKNGTLVGENPAVDYLEKWCVK